jgi:pyruvate dehydrogenase phosphatase
MYVANLGDCKARLFTKEDDHYNIVKLTESHNAEKPKEMEILKNQFPDEEDIVVCKKPDNKVCYVKGRLQPTRVSIYFKSLVDW